MLGLVMLFAWGLPRAEEGAQAVFSDVRPALLQVRTLVGPGEQQSSIGSGFLVSADGLAITNYHVVAQHALEPSSYRLQYVSPDGRRGSLALLAIDVLNDLAVVRVDGAASRWLEFDPIALDGGTPQGERLFAIGNPLDLGFTIVEGTHNGRAERSYVERIHFSGALNPGMSGGPALTRERRIAGVNVARALGGQLVSFLVPPRAAADLLERARTSEPMSLDQVRAEIGRQLEHWQAGLYAALEREPARRLAFGRFSVEIREPNWLSCWAQTNAHDRPAPMVRVDATRCSLQDGLFIASSLQTGQFSLAHSHLRNERLNAVQFARYAGQRYAPAQTQRLGARRWLTAPGCHDHFVAASEDGPPLRALFCARAHREFAGLYDVEVAVVTQAAGDQTLVSQLSMSGVAWPTALEQTRQLIGGIRWQR